MNTRDSLESFDTNRIVQEVFFGLLIRHTTLLQGAGSDEEFPARQGDSGGYAALNVHLKGPKSRYHPVRK